MGSFVGVVSAGAVLALWWFVSALAAPTPSPPDPWRDAACQGTGDDDATDPGLDR